MAFDAVRGEQANDVFSVVTAAQIASHILGRAGEGPTPLAYRGCLAHGNFDIDGNFLAGTAVNEAAEAYEAAEAGIVWLAPSAKQVLDVDGGGAAQDSTALRGNWRVSLKGGQGYRTHVINPFGPTPREEHSRWRDRVLATFSGSLAIEVKKENTREFLDRMIDATQRNIYALTEY